MIPPTYRMQSWLTPWVDLRQWEGQSSGYAAWRAGVWASWPEALESGAAGTTLPSGYWSAMPALEGIRRSNTAGLLTPEGYDPQGLSVSGSYLLDLGTIVPSRGLKNDPIAIDAVDGGSTVTLGGITARNTHSRRRQWQVEFLMDGPLDTWTSSATDVRTKWQAFLQRADKGVTVYLFGAEWATSVPLDQAIGIRWAYPGTPNKISGALIDATMTRWTPPKTGILSRYEVTLTIAEVAAPGRI